MLYTGRASKFPVLIKPKLFSHSFLSGGQLVSGAMMFGLGLCCCSKWKAVAVATVAVAAKGEKLLFLKSIGCRKKLNNIY